MAKRFCKLNRRDITEHLGEIHSLVTQPKFVCRSCARSSADEANLCKPTAIPPLGCQNKPDEEKVACGLLAETLPAPELSLTEINETLEPTVKMFDPAVAEIEDKASITDKASQKKAKLKKMMAKTSGDDKSELKQAKKAAKKQEKYNKKLAKMIKKQQKLFKKSQRLESDLERINLQLDDVTFTESKTQVVSHNHIH
ncbi:hypothetical protein [Vibrio echinoideorum]|uniref:hypothetical protein n=1 Tax=Vibrio echinoideorum TaxID=2100116 RepID=UPI00354BB034